MNPADRMLRAALIYAVRFCFAVFVVCWRSPAYTCSCGRADCASPAKHPLTRHGCKDAVRDPAALRAMFARWPNANLAIATGPPSGIFVLDSDPRHGGDESLAALEARFGKLPETPTVLTGGGGLHLYWRLPAGVEIKNSSGVLAPGLDVRGTSGFVIAPPSVHANGNLYQWEICARIDEIAIANPPDWLLERILNSSVSPHEGNSNRQSERVNYARLVAGIPDGEREWQLFRLACSLRRRGYSREFAEEVVVEAARRCIPPGSERVARLKVRSAWRYQ
jgi:hypothetical protein